MRRFVQFVAGMLVALMAIPLSAAAPCQQATHPMKCCQAGCLMMTKTLGAKVTRGTNPEMTRSACCSLSSRRAIPVAEQRTTENRTDLAMLHSQTLDAFIVVVEQRELKSLHEGPPAFRPSRTVLCTFLI